MTKERLEAVTTVTALCARHVSLPAHTISRCVLQLARIAASLHKRYEAMCSYQWADTARYARLTEKLEEKAAQLGVELEIKIDHQRDPRGWPLILTIGATEIRLG